MKREFITIMVGIIFFYMMFSALKGLEKKIEEEMRRVNNPTACEQILGPDCLPTPHPEEF